MKNDRWIKWYQYGDTGLINFGQMPVSSASKELQKFEREAVELLNKSGADHVVYGLRICAGDGELGCVKFYMKMMSDEDFQNDVATLRNCVVYAVHKR